MLPATAFIRTWLIQESCKYRHTPEVLDGNVRLALVLWFGYFLGIQWSARNNAGMCPAHRPTLFNVQNDLAIQSVPSSFPGATGPTSTGDTDTPPTVRIYM